MGYGPAHQRPAPAVRPAARRRRRGAVRAGRAVAAAGPGRVLRRAVPDRGPGRGRGAGLGRGRAGDSVAGGGDRGDSRPPKAPQQGLLRARRGRLGGQCPSGDCPPAGGAMTTTNAPARSATAGSVPARPWLAVTREVAGDRVDQVVFAAVAAAAGFGYSVLLPFDYTQRVSLANWQYFGPRYAAFTAGFALGLAWVVTLQVHAMRRIARNTRAGRPRRGGPAGAAAEVVSLLPSLLCCSPVVPTLVGLVGLPAATRLQTTGTITYFFAAKQDWLLGGALALLAAAGLWSVRKLARASCLAGDGCEVPASRGAAAARAGPPEPPGDSERDQPAHGPAAGQRAQGGGR